MRILPVRNYNYQSKTQNNKQQNVNFGMFKGDAVDAERLCKAEFVKVSDFLSELMEKVQAKLPIGHNKTSLRNPFSPNEETEFVNCINEARLKNMVMSPHEKRIMTEISESSEAAIPNRSLVGIIKDKIERANPVTESIQVKLARLEFCTKEREQLDIILKGGNTSELTEQKRALLTETNRIKMNLYDVSVVNLSCFRDFY